MIHNREGRPSPAVDRMLEEVDDPRVRRLATLLHLGFDSEPDMPTTNADRAIQAALAINDLIQAQVAAALTERQTVLPSDMTPIHDLPHIPRAAQPR